MTNADIAGLAHEIARRMVRLTARLEDRLSDDWIQRNVAAEADTVLREWRDENKLTRGY